MGLLEDKNMTREEHNRIVVGVALLIVVLFSAFPSGHLAAIGAALAAAVVIFGLK